eukprot:COSAG01_NODE_6664_length_3557_cov_2.259977_3_plen_378_part_00
MRHLSIVRVAVMQKTDTAACRRQAVQNTNLLQKALAKIRMAKVAAAFTTWMDQWRMLRIGRCCLRKMVHRRKLISLRRWQKATKQRIFTRLEAAAKASRIDSEEKERVLQTKLAEGSAMMERLSVLVARQRVSKDLRMRARIGWKQWQVAWLSAKLVKVREAHAAETLQVHLGAEKEKGKLLRRKKQLEAEVSTLQGRIAAIKEDAKKGPRKRAAELEARAAAAEEELEQVAALKAELSAMSEKAAGALLAKEAAERSAAAHKSALERAHVVQTEELRGTQGRRDSLTSCATGSSGVRCAIDSVWAMPVRSAAKGGGSAATSQAELAGRASRTGARGWPCTHSAHHFTLRLAPPDALLCGLAVENVPAGCLRAPNPA